MLASHSQEHSNTNLSKCQELWFEDGNVVIQAESMLFKVHRGILSAQSSVFADMFSMPAPQGGGDCNENYEGCPVVRLYDLSEEVAYFLKAVVDSSTFSSPNKPKFDQVVAFARLGTKYNVRHIRAFALRILRQAYPSSLDQFDNAQKHKPFAGSSGIIFKTINLARELDILDILPAAFVLASQAALPRIISKNTMGIELNDGDKAICIAGRELLLQSRGRVYSFLTSSAQCSSADYCNAIRLQCLRAVLDSLLHPLSSQLSTSLCAECLIGWERNLEERRRELWEEVPEMFKLPRWEVLREMKRYDETETAGVI